MSAVGSDGTEWSDDITPFNDVEDSDGSEGEKLELPYIYCGYWHILYAPRLFC